VELSQALEHHSIAKLDSQPHTVDLTIGTCISVLALAAAINQEPQIFAVDVLTGMKRVLMSQLTQLLRNVRTKTQHGKENKRKLLNG